MKFEPLPYKVKIFARTFLPGTIPESINPREFDKFLENSRKLAPTK